MNRLEPISSKASIFCHTECEYFPCHSTDCPEDFNCLFCYCPLYALGARCGGDFSYTAAGIKDCSACMKPHLRDSASMIRARFPELVRLTQADRK